ncbi:MAG TPA: glycosyltransferase family 87 protein [Terracidiphilus sp.]|nr:glycosyltransferase family 87 protein [Terracidiphilus sp.]
MKTQSTSDPRPNAGARARHDGLYLMVLGCAVFIFGGAALEHAAPVTTQDFRVLYFSARTLLEHRDPYNEKDLDYTYQVDGGETANDTPKLRQTERQYIYFPTAFVVTIPFAMLSWGASQVVWSLFTAVAMVVASLLIWDLGAKYAPILSGALIGLSFVNSILFLPIGNPCGIVVGLSIVAIWCFLKERFVWAGVFCLAVSLVLKPHVAGLFWVYLLFVGGSNRKRALQVLALTIAVCLPYLWWVSHVAPHWVGEMHSILSSYSARGGINDPGPSSAAGHGIGMIVSLQPVFSYFWDNSGFYNPASYLVFLSLFCAWAWITLHARFSTRMAWLAVAPIAAMSLLPVYHRLGDAKLLLLTVPACAMLWSEGGRLGRLAAAVNVLAFFLTGEPQWAIFLRVLSLVDLHGWLPAGLKTALQMLPVPLCLLLVSLFYLRVFMICRAEPSPELSAE